MAKIDIIISITRKEFEALSFFRHEISDKMESATDEKFLTSIENCLEHYNNFKKRLFASKSKKIKILEAEIKAFSELRYECAGKLEGSEDMEYLASFNYHDKRYHNVIKKYHNEKNKSTVAWALSQAKKRGLMID